MIADCRFDASLSRIASAMGEPARARMLCCLVDGHARTSTELALVADVSPSTASAHLNRLKAERLVKMAVQGKHRYYSLEGPQVAEAMEGLSALAGRLPDQFVPNAFVPTTPSRLRAARCCYDHPAGTLGVALHDRLRELNWIAADPSGIDDAYELTKEGSEAFQSLRIDVKATRALRRRFAYACLDWSERRPHLGGALGAALLKVALKRKWVAEDPGSRALRVTGAGRREITARFRLPLPSCN